MKNKGLIQSELARLNKVRAFTPNIHAKWMEEENDRSFIEWCRRDERTPVGYAGLPSILYKRDMVRAWKWWSYLLP